MTDHLDYFAIPALNWSLLKEMSVSPLHFRHRQQTPRPDSPAMALGRAVHTAVLEPVTLPLQYTTFDGARRGKDWTEFRDVNVDKDILTVPEWDKVMAIQEAVAQHPIAGPLLSGGQPEVTIRWRDKDTGLDLKARADYIKGSVLIDLKTTRSLDPHDFQRTYWQFKYNCQLAFYLNGMRATGRGFVDCFIVAVESEPPHDVAVFRPTDDSLYAGAEEVEALLDRLVACTASDEWPGRYPEETPLDLPPWAYPSDDAIADLLIKGT